MNSQARPPVESEDRGGDGSVLKERRWKIVKTERRRVSGLKNNPMFAGQHEGLTLTFLDMNLKGDHLVTM